MWTKKDLQTQDPSESPLPPPASHARFVPEERIDVIRKVANSREEKDKLKAELESWGYTVMVRETAAPPAEGEYYTAILFAERREPVMTDTWAAEREKLAEKKHNKKITLTAKLGFWVLITLALLIFLYFISPLIRACRAL